MTPLAASHRFSKFFVSTHADSNRTVPEYMYENGLSISLTRKRRPYEASVLGGNTNKTRAREGRTASTASGNRPDGMQPCSPESFMPRAKNPCFAINKHYL